MPTHPALITDYPPHVLCDSYEGCLSRDIIVTVLPDLWLAREFYGVKQPDVTCCVCGSWEPKYPPHHIWTHYKPYSTATIINYYLARGTHIRSK
jgi:hypothetical protein